MKKYILILFPIVFFGQTQTQNYIKSRTYKVPSQSSISNASTNQVTQSVTYFDGLGNPKQKILNRQSSSEYDIITHIEYDEFGRQKRDFLPYVSTHNNMEIDNNALYNTLNYSQYLNQYPYSEKEFDQSPLNLVVKQSAPGNDWKMGSGNEVKFETKLNTTDEIINFGVYDGNLVNYGYYKPNLIRKKVIKNENWKVQDNNNNTIHEFTDNFGNIILKRVFDNNILHDTYYVYDKIGNLSYVLPPIFFDNFSIQPSSQNSCSFNKSIDFKEVLRHPGYEGGPMQGGGGVYISVANNVISINFSGSFQPCILKENSMPLIISPDQCKLPDMSIGYAKFGTNSYDYFVYIENNRLRIVKKNPWQATVQIQNFNNETIVATIDQSTSISTIDSSLLNYICYQYKYDEYNRLVEKKLPGKQWEFIVYDKLDRVVATGDHTRSLWLITEYDVFNRVTKTGWKQMTVSPTERKNYQTTINGGTNPFVLTTNEILTENFYDNYSFPGAPTLPTTVEGQSVATNVKGLPTGSWVRILSSSNPVTAEQSYIVYDTKYRPIRQYTTNFLGGYTQVDTKLDWIGKTEYTVTNHKYTSTSTILKVKDSYIYTPQDKLGIHKHQINQGSEMLLSKNTYDELGQLITKYIGGTDVTGVSSYQKIDYKYNIRGWLKEINDVNDLVTDNDLFAFKLSYNSGSKPLYNGNISETYWRSASDNTLRKYEYQYDSLNRLLEANYKKPGSNATANSYMEKLSYDKNGNIKTLLRNGDLDADVFAIEIDDLTYTYHPDKPNQLMKVFDSSNHPEGFKDDSNGITDAQDDYEYDDFGNLIKDDNKKIINITYNHLNLPTWIQFADGKNISYIYNATGQKLRKIIREIPNSLESNSIDYMKGGFQYTNSNLNFFPHAEGYVNVFKRKNGSLDYNYVYQYKDHLGNNRMNFTGSTTLVLGGSPQVEMEIMEESHYYPFGLKHTSYNTSLYDFVEVEDGNDYYINLAPVSGDNLAYKYKYNGKEFQDELGLNFYDYGARNYDAAIGRWMNIDPLAENSRRWTPYNYAYNNPMYFVDPDGMQADWFENEITGDVYYNSEMRAGDEGTGAMKGAGWNHMGKNGMFGTSDGVVLAENKKFIEGGIASTNPIYDTNSPPNNPTIVGFGKEAMFKGENATNFMDGRGYEFNDKTSFSNVTTQNLVNQITPAGGSVSVTNTYGLEVVTARTYVEKGMEQNSSMQLFSQTDRANGYSSIFKTNYTYSEPSVFKKALNFVFDVIDTKNGDFSQQSSSVQKVYGWKGVTDKSLLKFKK